MRYLFVLALFCGSAWAQQEIDYSQRPPEDWPQLQQSIQRGTFEDIKRWCGAPMEVRDRVIGCAKIYFQHDLCMIFVSGDDSELLKHEQAHCDGFGHAGERNRHGDEWTKFKATRKQ